MAQFPPLPSGNGLRIDLFLSIGPYQAPIISQALELLYRGVILTRRICDVCHYDPGLNAERVQFNRVIHVRHGFVVSFQGLHKAPVLQMSVCIIGIELEGEPVFLLCFGPIPRVFEGLCQRKMSFREGGIEFQRFCRRHPGVRQSLFRGMASPDRISEQDIGVGQSRVRRSVSWVFLDRSLKVSNRYLDVRLCVLSFICELGMVSWS